MNLPLPLRPLPLMLCVLLAAGHADAGMRSSSFSSSSRGFAVRSAPSYRSTSVSTGATNPVRYRSFTPLTSAGGKTTSPGSATGFSRSVLSGPGPQPTQKLQTIIREKERSGPGWMGTAMLVWLLSQHDLSSSDRDWVESRLEEARQRGEKIETPPAEQSDVTFDWSLPSAFIAGQQASLTVTTLRGKQPVTVTCRINDTRSTDAGNTSRLVWTPAAPGTAVADCHADGWVDQRLLIIK